ncbi:4899_t:CDS:1, partial [Diversispora eburnea]
GPVDSSNGHSLKFVSTLIPHFTFKGQQYFCNTELYLKVGSPWNK